MLFKNTTEETGSRLHTLEKKALTQEQRAWWLFSTYSHQDFTAESFKRAYEERFSVHLKDSTVPRILSNMSSGGKPLLLKSDKPTTISSCGIKCNTWRANPERFEQGGLFCETVGQMGEEC